MKRKATPILITGSHRSGTTWTGKIISTAPHVGYIHEPFNIDIKRGVRSKTLKYWFRYFNDHYSGNFRKIFNGIIRYEYPLFENLKDIRRFKNILEILRSQCQCIYHRLNQDRPLVKDPIAIFSAEWLFKTYNMDVLVLIRHPAAFCSSLKIKNWKFDFNNFLDQPQLIKKYLLTYQEEIIEFAKAEKSIIEQGILLWNCINHTIRVYQEKYPGWLFVQHETLSIDPVNQFRSIFKEFGLDFTTKVKARIIETTGVHNPIEANAKNPFIRNSKENIKNWKNLLTLDEVALIKDQTSELASLFYTEADW